ncbi:MULTISPECIES: NF038122 family metalloprotease [Okeania]|nr:MULTISPECIES: NF038122 family metalloprotease [Okeania]NET12859.1 PEP-CTERM sorting domain-containing protein [Okeania sp. SIO1H6]NES76045.1 PEP-CTERM sorting domain-containing protein [Okeania sp. SIO1H4]NES88167.1 PEP-CTERM sorting domain-containing protein [Okeania sp. SIO2B9]NET21522.1 PEP-CTERM sorting domain-containing protein [Okeania sp. SIO1H5]NET94315.1 PEP-CTERM sorting domain-containing protein [Okeania sp. SIO1H2]
MKHSRLLALTVLSSVVSLYVKVPEVRALTINLTSTYNTQADIGFRKAADFWESQFTDDITVNINAGFEDLGENILGGALSTMAFTNYTSVWNTLLNDITSPYDTIAVSNLPPIPAFDLLINRTSDNPNFPPDFETPYLDNDGSENNSIIRMTTANAKALGFFVPPETFGDFDAEITFSSNFEYDFDNTDGITLETFDFEAIAIHEIGHALGFISGVDILDINSPPAGDMLFPGNAFTFVSPLDLYRYSDESFAQGALDWTADTREKYFSIDGGVTSEGTFSTGRFSGDGRQASHWEDNLGLGILDPTLAPGELGIVTRLDLLAFDVIGWDPVEKPTKDIPEPSPILGMLLAITGSVLLKTQIKSS